MLNSLTWVTQEVRLHYRCPKFWSRKPVFSAHLAAIPGKHQEKNASAWLGYLISVCCGGRTLIAVGKKAADLPENGR